MAKIDEEKLGELLAYLDSWRAGWASYQEWYRKEYKRRLARFELKRTKARILINRYLQSLDVDGFGRIRSDTKASRIKIQNFAKKRDRVLAALAVDARKIFGYTGHVDPKTGVFVGKIDQKLSRKIKDKLDASFMMIAGDLLND